MTGMFGALLVDAQRRRFPLEPFYAISKAALLAFKRIQGIPDDSPVPGTSLEQAYMIWNQTPRGMFEAILASVGVSVSDDYLQRDLITVYQSATMRDSNGEPGEVLYMRYVPPLPFRDIDNDASEEA
ncbi:hypothetical protein [Cupriavidus pinatubonensis]|uniref:hypothetical protein n=1 Tax=Cupriavidus pinatubonensis TaxID=248026 RepID=UPI001C6295B5|nr:hypothetical protein [Cupriavidus pinatubonensis]